MQVDSALGHRPSPPASHTMSAKKPKSKMEETQAFLDELAADFPDPAAAGTTTTAAAAATAAAPARKTGKKKLTGSSAAREKSKDAPVGDEASPRVSQTMERTGTPITTSDARVSTDQPQPPPPTLVVGEPTDAEADLAFLEAQLAAGGARRPGSALAGSRPGTPAEKDKEKATVGKATIGSVLQAPTGGRKSLEVSRTGTPVNEASSASAPTPAPQAGGWGSSWWSSASTMLNQAKSVAIEQVAHVARQADEVQSTARKVAVEGAGNVQGLVAGGTGLNLEAIAAKGGLGLQHLREQLGDRVKGVDLEKLRHELLSRGQSAISEIINTVAPPISEHEVLQVWFSHDMKGYDGVDNVVYAAIQAVSQPGSRLGVRADGAVDHATNILDGSRALLLEPRRTNEHRFVPLARRGTLDQSCRGVGRRVGKDGRDVARDQAEDEG